VTFVKAGLLFLNLNHQFFNTNIDGLNNIEIAEYSLQPVSPAYQINSMKIRSTGGCSANTTPA
jgi:hypothetical protein